MNLFGKIINWYFKKDSLPYWSIFLIDCIICFFSGLFVFALFFKPTNALANLPVISRTLLFYLIFNVIGFRWFHTYAGAHHLLAGITSMDCSPKSSSYYLHLYRFDHCFMGVSYRYQDDLRYSL